MSWFVKVILIHLYMSIGKKMTPTQWRMLCLNQYYVLFDVHSCLYSVSHYHLSHLSHFSIISAQQNTLSSINIASTNTIMVIGNHKLLLRPTIWLIYMALLFYYYFIEMLNNYCTCTYVLSIYVCMKIIKIFQKHWNCLYTYTSIYYMY